MQFLREDKQRAATAVSRQLISELHANKRVLWLVCGGSAIPVQAQIMHQVGLEAADLLQNLNILAGDDRYGPRGHADSNYKQLRDAGFDPGAASWHDVLENDVPLEETVTHYTELFQEAHATADVIIGVFGIGTDAHTAGIKPKSPAVQDDIASVVGYKWDDFTRLTLTPRELVKTDSAYVLAYGADKKLVLERLQRGDEPIETTPCNLLHDIANVTVYNDQIEGEHE